MTTAKTDEQLLADFVAGRRPALGELAERYETALLGLAAGLLGGRRDLAADAVQETWLRVIRFGGQFAGQSRFKTWVYRIAVNQCRNLQAAARPAAAPGGVATDATQAGNSSVGGQPVLENMPDRGASPAGVALEAEQNHVLRRAVVRLDDDKRIIVLLCYHSGMTHEQAAEILELPLGTLKSRLHAALVELREMLSADGPNSAVRTDANDKPTAGGGL